VLSRSAAAGADTFIKEQDGGSLFVFFQGHPEYDTDSLLREYRRDVGRFLRGEAGAYPQAPQNYFDGAAMFLADDFRTRAEGGPHGELIGEFPVRSLRAGIENTWHSNAITVYRNWVAFLKEQKSHRRSPATREQRVSA
jgi:homoserine O-succinyltransferase/O-acetyltransferase